MEYGVGVEGVEEHLVKSDGGCVHGHLIWHDARGSLPVVEFGVGTEGIAVARFVRPHPGVGVDGGGQGTATLPTVLFGPWHLLARAE